MKRAAVAVTVAVLLLLAGCGSGHHAAPTVTATAAACPTVGQMIDRYVTQLKAKATNPSLDFTGCTDQQKIDRLDDIQLIMDQGDVQ